MSNVKQVIVFRKDLLKGEKSIRKGKMCSSIAHASLACVLSLFKKEEIWKDNAFPSTGCRYTLEFDYGSYIDEWLNGKFTKICVSVDTDKELVKLYNRIKKENPNIPCELITDCGLTEFNGVPTNTCIGIGPYNSEEIDVFTKDLKLL